MVLEYVPGGTLEAHLQGQEPLPDDETRGIAAGIAAGLAHAHARGVVHRDLKPANVLFDEDGRPKLADFGIARMMAGEGTLTEAGTLLGTAAYISPEQAVGEPATAASDVYSFGVILYRMLTGRLPFESNDPMKLVMLHRDAPPPSIHEFRDDAPAALESTAMAALAKDPADRPHDGTALLAELGIPAGASLATAATMLSGPATQVLPRGAGARRSGGTAHVSRPATRAQAHAAHRRRPRRARTRGRRPRLCDDEHVLLDVRRTRRFRSRSRRASHTTSGATTTTAPTTSTAQTTTQQTTTAQTTAPRTTPPPTHGATPDDDTAAHHGAAASRRPRRRPRPRRRRRRPHRRRPQRPSRHRQRLRLRAGRRRRRRHRRLRLRRRRRQHRRHGRRRNVDAVVVCVDCVVDAAFVVAPAVVALVLVAP